MNHILAVYTVLYIAILFTTVGIWATDIAAATGDFRVLLFALGAFCLKLAIDDYVHFSKPRNGIQKSLTISLVIYLLLAGGIANAALARAYLAPFCFLVVFILGSVWIVVSDRDHNLVSTETRNRHLGWHCINALSVFLLVLALYLGVKQHYSRASLPLTALLALVVADFFILGTLRRLADAATIVGSAHAAPQAAQAGNFNDHPRAHEGDAPTPPAIREELPPATSVAHTKPVSADPMDASQPQPTSTP